VRTRPGGVESLSRQQRGEVHVAVAELDGVPVGRAALDFRRFAGERAAYLWAAHVEPARRSQGVGSAVLQHLERVAAERGCLSVRLAVGKDNPAALRLYRRLGYEVTGEEVQRWTYEDGERTVAVVEDCWTMEKRVI
jgi:ribosomal protein S18 acetylase RimI-like enzyme